MKRTKRACIKCGKLFYGGTDKTYCDECAKVIKSNVMRTRTCKSCGAEFLGGPRASYCPNCRRIRQREANERARKRGGATRPGSRQNSVPAAANHRGPSPPWPAVWS